MAWFRCGNGNGGGGSTIKRGTSAPTSAQGSNGQVYLQTIKGERQDLSTFNISVENSGCMEFKNFENTIYSKYIGGQNIAAQAYKQVDLTDIDEIQITVKTSAPSYDNYSTPRFSPLLIIENTTNPANDWPALYSIISANGETYRVSTQGDTETFIADVSGLTGNYWIVISCIGVTTEWSDLYFNSNADSEIIYKSYAKVSGAWQDLIGTEIEDIDGTEQAREALYSIDQSQGGAWINTNIPVANIDEFLFINSVSDQEDYSRTVKVSDIPVYTGTDVYLTVLSASETGGYDFNIRIYNGSLYVSYNGIGQNNKIVSIYKGGLEIGKVLALPIETASIYRWFYSQGSTCWGIMKMADGNVVGQNGDDSNASITLDGQTITVIFHGTSQSIEVTAKTNITLKAYSSSRTIGTITPTEYSMAANDTQTFTPDNLYGGLYLEAYQ